MKIPVFSATPLLAVLIWAAALVADPGPFAPGAVLLITVGLLAMATVGMVGITVTGGRWAHRTSLFAVGAMLVLSVVRPIDLWWALALVCTVLAGLALFSRTVTGGIRKLPAASGPPERAVLIPLLLIGLPFLLGVAAWGEPSAGTLIVGLSAPVTALWYARVFPGGLYTVRIVWPALAVGLAFTQWLAPAIVSLGAGVTIAVLAWHPSVKTAFHPPREIGTVHPIPPELAPSEVLHAAELDEKGRPKK